VKEHLLSICIPVKNEEHNVAPLAAAIKRSLQQGPNLDFEIIFVDDGSTDKTLEIIRNEARSDLHIRYVSLDRNYGQTTALVAGLRASRGSLIATMDGDLQNDPDDVPKMLAALEDCDMVCGIRQKRMDSWVRRISSRIANAVRNRLTGDDIIDVGCSLRVFKKECFTATKLYEGMHRFFPTLVKMEGFRIKQVPVKHHPRLKGATKYGIRNRLFVGIKDLLAVRWMQSRHIRYTVKESSP
jgi:glycosyltransferase involved in cell wall biosynthesis